MRTTFAFAALPLLLCSCLLPDVGARVHAGYLSLKPSGNFALRDSAGSNTIDSVRNDLEDGFDIDEDASAYVKAEVNLEDWDILASGFRMEQDSRSTLTHDFGDIPAGSQVDSNFRMLNLKAAATYKVLDFEFVDVGAGLCLDYFDLDMDVSSQIPAAFENMEYRAPVPMLYGRVTGGVGIVSGALGIGWMDADLGDGAGSYFDLDAMVTVKPLPFLEIAAGYRNILIDVHGEVDQQDYDTHMRLSGWYLGGGVRF